MKISARAHTAGRRPAGSHAVEGSGSASRPRLFARAALLSTVFAVITATVSPVAAHASLLGDLLSPLGPLPIPLPALPIVNPAPTPVPGPTDPLDVSRALRLEPPFVATSQSDPATADDTLTDQLTIEVCRYENNGCTPLPTMSGAPASTGTKISPALNKRYQASWSNPGTVEGQVFKFTWRVAGLNVGSNQLRAGNVTNLGQNGWFLPGVPVNVAFSVARNAIVTVRSLHDRGASSVDIGQRLQQGFLLSDSDTLTGVYRDIRTQDIKSFAPTPPTLAAANPSAGPVPCPYPPCSFPLGQVVDSVASPTTFHTPAKHVAELLKGRTPVGNQSVVNALASSLSLRNDGLSPGAVLEIIRTTLGVVDRTAGLKLIKNARGDDDSQAFDATAVLRAIREIDGAPSLVAALQQLGDVEYGPLESFTAVDAIGLLTGGSRDEKVAKLSKAALQVAQFSGTDTASAMSVLPSTTGLPPDQYLASLKTAANALVAENCGAYLVPQVGSVADLLKGKSDVVGPPDIVKALSDKSGCAFNLEEAGTALHNVYTGTITNKVLEGQKIAENLLRGLPQTPATALVLSLGKVLRNAVGAADDTVACLTVVASHLGAADGKGNPLPGITATDFSVPHLMTGLDSGDASKFFVSPFSTGPDSSLDKLGRCLTGNGVIPPLPLRKVTIRYTDALVNAVLGGFHNGDLLVGRAGFVPTLDPKVVPGVPAFDVLKGVQVPSLPALPNILKSALTLPVMVAGGPGRRVNLKSNEDYNWQWVHSNDRRNILEPGGLIAQEGSDHVFSLSGLPSVSFLTGGIQTNGVATLIVPAIPGTIQLEGTLFGNNNLQCFTAGLNPALMATAIATPRELYTAIPGGPGDIYAFGGDAKTLPESPPSGFARIPFSFDMHGNPDKCPFRTIRGDSLPGDDLYDISHGVNPFMAGDITVESIGAVDSLAALLNTVGRAATALKMAPGATPNGKDDYSITSALAGKTDPASLGGNFLSLLAAGGGVAPTGLALERLMGTGFLPA